MSKSKVLHFARFTLHSRDSRGFNSQSRNSIYDDAVTPANYHIAFGFIDRRMMMMNLYSPGDFGDEMRKEGRKEGTWIASASFSAIAVDLWIAFNPDTGWRS